MKKRFSLVCFAAAFAALFGTDTPQATAQVGPFGRAGSQAYEPDTFSRVAADVQIGLPGRIWVESNFADEGLGYNGSYVTIGGKTRLFEDFLDGRWLTEARLHHSVEDDGGFFANVGIERVFSIDAAKADIVTGFWYDFDGDQQGNFGHDFSQVGVNAAIKTRNWDLVGNGYFPVGITERTSGTPGAGNLFIGNNIQLQPGIDAALRGFDVTLRLKPKQLAFMNGSFEIGGYGYTSDLINSFGGGRVRLGMQTKRGLSVGLEINHDDRFETTGGIGIGYAFGGRGAVGGEYSSLGRDLEQTSRNDHIVRFNQDIELAIDPDTGAAYNVVHVNNTADGAIGDGTAETPFNALVDAQINSDEGDIIFVDAGDGTTNLYTQGITLQNDQLLLSTGAENLIQTQNRGLVRLNAAGIGATISNPGGFDVVRLADNNVVSGINIDAGGATNGISGNDIEGGVIRGTNISGASDDGVLLTNVRGNWTFDGVNASTNGRDGIHINNFSSDQITFRSTTTNTNSRHGIFLENDQLLGGTIDVISATSSNNTVNGLLVDSGDGSLNVVDSNFDNNTTGGIRTRNYTNSIAGQRTFVGASETGTSSVSGNLVAANLDFELDGDDLTQDVLVTGLTVDNGGQGIVGRTDGENTTLNLNVIDTVSINNNNNEGILATATGGSTINTNISSTGQPLQIIGNGIISGSAISLSATGPNSAIAPSRINSNIDNVQIQLPGNTAGGNGILISSAGNAVATSEISNANILRTIPPNPAIPNNLNVANGDNGIALNFANDGAGNINEVLVRDSTIETDNGVSLVTAANTFTDFAIRDSVLQAVGPRAVGRGPGLNNPTGSNFGDVGIQILATGDATDTDVDNLTRVSIERVTIQDFSGPNTTGFGGVVVLPPGVLLGTTVVPGGFNGLGEALPGAAVDVATFGDANLLLNLSSNQILNNGAGGDIDNDGDGFFGEQPFGTGEDPGSVLFYDAVKINALDTSVISTRIVGNFFQDNFERGISLDTYDSATINAQVTGNAFDNNDRGNDATRGTFRASPFGLDQAFASQGLAESQVFDFEAVNNEEFFQRAFESGLAIDGSNMNNGVIDVFPLDAMGMPDGDDIADLSFNTPGAANVFTDFIAPGFANLNLDLSGNAFEHGVLTADFSTAPGDFRLAGTPGFFGFGTSPITSAASGFADVLITNEELLFTANGF